MVADEEITVSGVVPASPEAVYAIVSDLPRMGDLSPENTGCSWVGGATGPGVGARFVGHNRIGWRRWSTKGVVAVAEPGREFAFEVTSIMNLRVARWGFRLQPTEGGTRVVEYTIDRRGAVMRALGAAVTGVSDRAQHNRITMRATLDRLAETVAEH